MTSSKTEDFNNAISEEKADFREQLTELLKEYRDKWVIFKDGKVIEAFDDKEVAYAKALDLFGLDEPFLIEIVQVEKLQPLSFSIELGTNYVT